MREVHNPFTTQDCPSEVIEGGMTLDSIAQDYVDQVRLDRENLVWQHGSLDECG